MNAIYNRSEILRRCRDTRGQIRLASEVKGSKKARERALRDGQIMQSRLKFFQRRLVNLKKSGL